MKTVFEKLQPSQKGFTLIELLVVIAILGVLSSIAIPNLASLLGSGKAEAAKTELSIVQTAVVAYIALHDGAIPDIGDFNEKGEGKGGDLAEFLTTKLGYGPYSLDPHTGKISRTTS